MLLLTTGLLFSKLMALALLLTRPMFLGIMNRKGSTKDWMWHSAPWSDVDVVMFGHSWTWCARGLFQPHWFCQPTTRSQQPGLPPVPTPLMSSSIVVSAWSSSALYVLGLSNACTRKLSLTYPLDFLQLAVLLSWQMPGWWKSSARMRCWSVMLSVSEAGGLDLDLPLIRPPPAGVLCWSCLWIFYPQAVNLFVAVFQRQAFHNLSLP